MKPEKIKKKGNVLIWIGLLLLVIWGIGIGSSSLGWGIHSLLLIGLTILGTRIAMHYIQRNEAQAALNENERSSTLKSRPNT